MSLFWRLAAVFSLLAASSTAHAAWHEAKSRHFIIYADLKPGEINEYAERLERFDQAVRTIRRMSDPPLTDAGRVTIFVLPNEAAIQSIYGGDGVYGFYISRVSGSVAFVPRKAGSKHNEEELDADAVFFHEYAHHLQLQGANIAMPPWVSEGFAEFFARTQLRDDGSVVIGVPPAYRAYSLFGNDALSIRDMLGAETRLNSDAEYEGIYARGWALTHYLTFADKRRGQFDRYLASIQSGVPPLKSAEQAFGNLGALAGELKSWVRKKELPHLILDGTRLMLGSIAVRQLSTAESGIMRVRMRLARGARRGTAGDIAGDARKAATDYPGDAAVQAALAQAEFEARNYVAANAAADRAVAADAKRLDALLSKGKAEMEIARQAGHGNWVEIRKWFLKANKVDSEAAEPLMLNYRCYLYGNEQPTKNAIAGLLYAVALVPQDDEVRLVAVRQLLIDGNIDEAKRLFGPIAYSPHWKSSWQNASNKAVAAMSNAQAGEALSYIERMQKLLGDDK